MKKGYDEVWLSKELKIRDIDFEKVMKPLDYKTLRKEMREFVITLDQDPTKDLIAALSSYATIDAYYHRVLEMNSRARRSFMRKENLLRTVKSIVEQSMFDIQTSDDEIAALSSADKRTAAAKSLLSDIIVTQDRIGTTLTEARAFQSEVEDKRRALESSYNSLSRQQSLIEGPILTIHPEKLGIRKTNLKGKDKQ